MQARLSEHPQHVGLFHDGRTGWREFRKRIVRQHGVNILAKRRVRSKWLRKLRSSYLKWSLPTPTRQLRPLREGEIRLLQIKPGLSLSTITCSFSYINLKAPSNYAALSYTWGVFNPSIPILMDGKVTLISENLYLALLHLRKRGIKTLWVDALCINQQDLTERASQVSQMKDVYENAAIVLVWLGESNALTELAFDELHGMTELLDYDEAVPSYHFDRQLMNRYHDRWRAISEMLYRPWFRRMWVIQEVLSARKGMMICDRDALDLLLFLKLVNSMWRANVLKYVLSYHPNRGELADGPMRIVYEQLVFLVKTKFEDTNFLMHGRFSHTLLNYLAETRWAEATDQRDKVYAVLSLVTNSRELGHWETGTKKKRTWVPFKVDYESWTQEHVFIHAAKAMISTSRSLDVLRFAGLYSHGESRLPSWVPDWTKKNPPPVHDYLSLSILPSGKEETWRLRRRTAEKKKKKDQSSDSIQIHNYITTHCSPGFSFGKPDTLILKGIRFDTIAAVSATAYPAHRPTHSIDPRCIEETPESIDAMKIYLEDFSNWLEDAMYLAATCTPYPTGATTQTAFWNVLNADKDANESPVATDPSFETVLDNLENVKAALSAFRNHLFSSSSGTLSQNRDTETAAAAAAWTRAKHHLAQLPKPNSACVGRKFGTTARKGYFGLVPYGAKEGDIVCVVYGSERPFILRTVSGRRRRRQQQRFQFIGHGVFEGFDFDDAVVEKVDRLGEEVFVDLKDTEEFAIS